MTGPCRVGGREARDDKERRYAPKFYGGELRHMLL